METALSYLPLSNWWTLPLREQQAVFHDRAWANKGKKCMQGCLPDSSPWSHWHMYSKEWTTRVLWKVFWVGKSLPWIPSVIVPIVERGFWPLNSKFSHEMLRSNWGMSSLGRISSYIGTNCQKSVFEVFDICKLFSLGLWNCLCAKVTSCSLLNVWIWICRFLIYKVNLLCGYDRVKSYLLNYCACFQTVL